MPRATLQPRAAGTARTRLRRGSAWRIAWPILGALLAAPVRDACADSAADPGADPGADPAAAVIQAVYVTARHEVESANDVPISLSTLTGSQLQQTGTFTLSAIQYQVPNLLAYDTNPRNSSIGIRGFGVTSAQDGMDTSVGVYIDGVYLGRPGMALADLIDVNQVEVLRGPQGTLFGRNSSAGVLNITTNQPSFKPGLTAEVSGGDDAYNQEWLAATGPLIPDLLAYRLTLFNTYRDGTLDNVTTGGRDNGIRRSRARTQFLLLPADPVAIRLSLDYSIEADSENTDAVKEVLPSSLATSTAAAQEALTEAGWKPVANPDVAVVNSPQDMRTRQGGAAAEVDWSLGWGKLTSITAYRFWQFFPLQDSDDTPLDIFEVNVAQTHDVQATQEIRLAWKTRAFDWQTGVFLFHQGLRDHYILHQYGFLAATYYTDYARLLNPAAAAVVIAPRSQYIDSVLTHEDSAAAFGQANWHLTDRLTLTGGLRYTADRRTGTAASSTLGVVPASLATPFAYDLEVQGRNVSTLGSIAYELFPGSLLYASYSTGYKAAGLNLDSASVPTGGRILKPETVVNYETGIKQRLWNGRAVIDADVYWTDLNGLQANYYPPNGAKSYLTNVGNARARGVELTAALNLTRGLSLTASGAYNRARYTSYPDAPCPVGVSGVCNLTGKPLYEAPTGVGNAAADYRFDYGARFQPYLWLEYSYTSSYFGTIDDGPYTRIAGYGLANVRLGLHSSDDRYDVSLWAKNMFDKRYFTTLNTASVNATWGITGEPGDPLTFGATLHARF
jgi:iron complex outermembrane recepter protein